MAQEFGVAREIVRKMLRYYLPPGYRRERPVKRPMPRPWIGVINAILEEDKNNPVKQRHTAKRIFNRLRQECAYTSGHTIVKDYVRLQRVRTKEMFVPLSHTRVDSMGRNEERGKAGFHEGLCPQTHIVVTLKQEGAVTTCNIAVTLL